jgi:hypothetical protein
MCTQKHAPLSPTCIHGALGLATALAPLALAMLATNMMPNFATRAPTPCAPYDQMPAITLRPSIPQTTMRHHDNARTISADSMTTHTQRYLLAENTHPRNAKRGAPSSHTCAHIHAASAARHDTRAPKAPHIQSAPDRHPFPYNVCVGEPATVPSPTTHPCAKLAGPFSFKRCNLATGHFGRFRVRY